MKALVLCGGMGPRLRSMTHSLPEQLVPVGGKVVLELALANIVGASVTEIGIVVGDPIAALRERIGDGSRFDARITYVLQTEPLGLAHCVLVARKFLGDNLVPEGVDYLACEFAAARPDAQNVVQKVADPSAFGVAEIDADGTVLRLVEKAARPRSDLALIGLYFFTSAIHEAAAAIGPGARGKLEITDAIQGLTSRNRTVKASEYTGYWADIGHVDGVPDANGRLIDGLTPAFAGEIDTASRVIGDVVVEPGARVVRSMTVGLAIIGAGTVVEDSYVGRYTSIGSNCTLWDTHIDDLIVLESPTLSGLRGLRGSVIGRRTAVRSAGEGRRLIVGDDSQVEVAR